MPSTFIFIGKTKTRRKRRTSERDYHRYVHQRIHSFWTIDFRLKMVDVQFSAKSKDDPSTLDKMQFYSLDERILVRLVLFSLRENQTHNHKKRSATFLYHNSTWFTILYCLFIQLHFLFEKAFSKVSSISRAPESLHRYRPNKREKIRKRL